MRCALGFSVHIGRAIAVAVGAGEEGPRLLERDQFELISGGFEVGAVYHVSRSLPLSEAQRKVEAVLAEASRRATQAIASLVSRLRLQGHGPGACAIVGVPRRALPDLARILRSHPLVHAAEGELYRAAVVAGAKASGMDATAMAVECLDTGAALVRALGRGAGPPWGRDQKLAALAAATLIRA